MTLHLAILRCAAMLVPASYRAGWLNEWQSELWYVKRKRAIPFCLGAFRDAFWMRRNSSEARGNRAVRLQSPLQCLALLSILAAIVIFFAFRLTVPRNLLLPFPYPDARTLVMIASSDPYDTRSPSVSIAQYRSIATNQRRQFSDFAFYKTVRIPVRRPSGAAREFSVVFASENLFLLLQVPVASRAGTLILSESAWCKRFGRAPGIIGSRVELGGKQIVVSAILPDRWWRLPGKADAWLLQDDSGLAGRPQHEKGFVLARMWTPSNFPTWNWRWQILSPNAEGDYTSFECGSLVQKEIAFGCAFMLAIAWLLLSVTTSFALGEYPAKHDRQSWNIWLRRWLFLGAKLLLLFVIVLFGALDFIPTPILPHSILAGYIVAFRWALNDQRERCPVCLRRLISPVRVGCPSHVFLAWYGTELACPKGHGLMHVPEIPTSCYSTQRWFHLDPSWRSLFS